MLKIFQVRVQVSGEKLSQDQAVILLSNHVSYLDIMVLSALTSGRFVSRADLANWPFLGYLAKKQKTIFVDRRPKNVVGQIAKLAQEFQKKTPIIIFPRGDF